MTTHDDDEDFPLADLPGPGGPKAGDPDMNRARDIMHLDVKAKRSTALDVATPTEEDPARKMPTTLPDDSPVTKAWKAFHASGGYDKAISQFDLFMAGWAARDAQ